MFLTQVLKSGAPERVKLEPFELRELLEELEDWAEVLEGEPEVIHRLSEFTAAASEGCEDGREAVDVSPAPADLEFLEPSL